jgi:hypothetical protein
MYPDPNTSTNRVIVRHTDTVLTSQEYMSNTRTSTILQISIIPPPAHHTEFIPVRPARNKTPVNRSERELSRPDLKRQNSFQRITVHTKRLLRSKTALKQRLSSKPTLNRSALLSKTRHSREPRSRPFYPRHQALIRISCLARRGNLL